MPFDPADTMIDNFPTYIIKKNRNINFSYHIMRTKRDIFSSEYQSSLSRHIVKDDNKKILELIKYKKIDTLSSYRPNNFDINNSLTINHS